MLHKDLQKFGFTKNLATIYALLAELGEAKAGEIVKKTGLHRNIVYLALQTLEAKQLIMKTERRGIALFKMLDPKRIMNEAKEKERFASGIMEELQRLHKPHTQQIVVHEGIEEIQRAEETLYRSAKTGDTMYILGRSLHWSSVMGRPVIQTLVDIQKEKKMIIKGITAGMTNDDMAYALRTNGLTFFKSISGITSKTDEISIMGDKILMKHFVSPYTTIEITNPELAKSYQEYAKILWQQEVTTYRGWEEIEKLFFKEIFPRETAEATGYCIGGGYGEGGDDKRVEEFYIQYNSMRTKKNIPRQIIFFEQHREKAKQEFIQSGDPTLAFIELRFLPKEYYSPLQIQLIADKAIVILWSKTPVATVYERKEIFDSFKKQFDLLWSTAKM